MLVGNLGITANNFINTGGSIIADTFSVTVAGDFNYADNYLNNRNIDATTLNFRIGGDFSYDDANFNFVWNASDSLVVLGSVFINAYDSFNRSRIDVANDFNVTAGTYFYNVYSATINADRFNVTAVEDFLNRYATINASSVEKIICINKHTS